MNQIAFDLRPFNFRIHLFRLLHGAERGRVSPTLMFFFVIGEGQAILYK